MQYLAYYQPPTSVSDAIRGDFIQPGVAALVQAKTNRLEVHSIDGSEGAGSVSLKLALTATIHGTILRICPIRLRACPTLTVGVLTTNYTLFILSFENGNIQTVASHNVEERSASKSTELVTLLAYSDSGNSADGSSKEPTRFLVIHAFQGLTRIVLLDEGPDKRRNSKSSKDDAAVDLSRGFTVRMPELLLNSMVLLPPSGASAHPRLATIHTNIVGQRVLQLHLLNTQTKSLEPEDAEKAGNATAFLPSSGLVLSDPDACLIIPVLTLTVEGIIIVGQDSARFVHTGTPNRKEPRNDTAAIAEEMAVDEASPSKSPSARRMSSSGQVFSSKGKGKARDPPSPTARNLQLSTSPENMLQSSTSPPRAGAIPIPGVRRRSSAAAGPSSLDVQATSPPTGTKRKLSEGANSSGRGKASARRDTRPIECMLPVSEYTSFCALADDPTRFLLVDAWGQAMHLCVKTSSRSMSASSPPAASIADSFGKLATSPTSPKSAAGGRRLSRSSISSGSSGFVKVSLVVEKIVNGRVSSPTCLVDMRDGKIFVGSHFGDSLLVQLPHGNADLPMPKIISMEMEGIDASEVEEEGLTIVSAYTNLAPIVDFCVVGSGDGQGPSHVVTCSGGKDDGTLRIVRHGVGLSELASLDMEGVQRLWTLQSEGQNLLVLSFVNETRILAFASGGDGEDTSIEELDAVAPFSLAQPTLLAFSSGGQLVQVTPEIVNIGRSSWTPSQRKKITLASACDNYILLALAGGEVVLLSFGGDNDIQPVASAIMAQEVACLSLDALSRVANGPPELLASVGLWTVHQVVLLSVPDLRIRETLAVETSFLLRSVLSITLSPPAHQQNAGKESGSYLFVGLGDGTLLSYSLLEPSSLEAPLLDLNSKKTLSLGIRPVSLHAIETACSETSDEAGAVEPAVFVASDRSTIISRSSGKLSYASANLKDISDVTTLSNPSYPNSIVLALPTGLQIGRIDSLQKLHVKTLRLGDLAPRRICYSQSLQSYGIIFLKETLDRTTGSVERESSFKILDATTFEVLGDFPLQPNEEARSIVCFDVSESSEEDEATERFVLGTGFIDPEEPECSRGRVIVFSADQSAMGDAMSYSQTAEAETRGAVHSIAKLDNGRFAASSNHEIIAYSWSEPGVLEQLCSWGGTFVAYSLISRGNLLVAVDPLRSSSMIEYDPEANKLNDVAREYSSYGVFAAAFLHGESSTPAIQAASSAGGEKADKIIVADLDLNLFTAVRGKTLSTSKKSMAGPAGSDTSESLTTQAVVHLGEVVNKFAQGSLVPAFASHDSSDGKQTQPLIFATSNGSLGMIASLSSETSRLLSDLERNMVKALDRPLGGLKQSDYRSFKTPYRACPSLGFIDGSYVEELLNDTSVEDVDLVLRGANEHERIGTARDEVIRVVEQLQRLH